MKRIQPAALSLICLICAATSVLAQESRPALFIPPTGDGFDVYLAAAIAKKNVPAKVVASPDSAALTLKAAQVEVRKDSRRMKLAKCILQSCANIEDKASTSVQLVDREGAVLWSFAIDGDDGSKKSMAESIAKRLKRDYFRQ